MSTLSSEVSAAFIDTYRSIILNNEIEINGFFGDN